jgi:hypothetical protein
MRIDNESDDPLDLKIKQARECERLAEELSQLIASITSSVRRAESFLSVAESFGQLSLLWFLLKLAEFFPIANHQDHYSRAQRLLLSVELSSDLNLFSDASRTKKVREQSYLQLICKNGALNKVDYRIRRQHLAESMRLITISIFASPYAQQAKASFYDSPAQLDEYLSKMKMLYNHLQSRLECARVAYLNLAFDEDNFSLAFQLWLTFYSSSTLHAFDSPAKIESFLRKMKADPSGQIYIDRWEDANGSIAGKSNGQVISLMLGLYGILKSSAQPLPNTPYPKHWQIEPAGLPTPPFMPKFSL